MNTLSIGIKSFGEAQSKARRVNAQRGQGLAMSIERTPKEKGVKDD